MPGTNWKMMTHPRLAALRHSLAFLLSRKTNLLNSAGPRDTVIRSGSDRFTFDVSGLRRGLHFISLRYRAEPPFMGPRVCWESDADEGDHEVFVFEAGSGRELFGTVLIAEGVHSLHFYPSRLESRCFLDSVTIRPITEFARERIYGVPYVQYKMFGLKWLLGRLLADAWARLRRRPRENRDSGYGQWWESHGRCPTEELARQAGDETLPGEAPLISVVLPTFKPNRELLEAAVQSVVAQTYPRWQLCICDDASGDLSLTEYLEHLAASDERISVCSREKNGHISAATNDALALATGEFVGFLDHDDLLTPDALYRYARAIRDNPALELLYSDEDLVSEEGEPVNGHFKPDWNPDLARSINYLCHFLVVRRARVAAVGGLRTGFEGAQDYDLIQRVSEDLAADRIHHIPRVLYHWRAAAGSTASGVDNKPYAAESGLKALAETLRRTGLDAVAEASEIPTAYRVRYRLPDPAPAVSVIVPTRDELRVVRNCLRSVLELTDYPRYEVVIVDNGSSEPDTLAWFEEVARDERVRLLRWDQPFNFSAINNFAVDACDSDVVVLLNNDTEVLNSGWLEELVTQAIRPEVGAVGAKLIYANDRLQHAGVILGLGGDGIAGHAFKGRHRNEVGSLARTRLVQEYSAVTGACLAVARDKYLQVGGLDEVELAVAYNDVDLCLKLRDLGYRNIWTPYAQLYHYESYTRGPDTADHAVERYTAEAATMRNRWSHLLDHDPCYNPNLSRGLYSYELAWPPHGEPGSI